VSAGAKFNTYSKAPSATPKRKKDRGAANQELLLHSSSHQKLDYTAREDKTKGSEVLKHYIGIFDPSTGQLDVVEAKKMVVRGVVRSQQAPEEALRPRDTTQVRS
jgi:DNA-directed RNA polymerase I subunit RPA49